MHRAEPGRGAEGRRRVSARSDGGCGSTASGARASCGTRSCARPTTTPSRACCSSTASTATTTWLLRKHRRDQPVRRAAAAGLRLLLPGLDRPDALRVAPVRGRRARSTRRGFADVAAAGGAHARQRARRRRVWPLPQQQEEARRKRRIGLGFTGLGDALVMLNLRYDSDDGARDRRAASPQSMRDAAYDASVDLARERGAFPLFNADLYLSAGTFASRLPQALKRAHPRARPAQLAPAVDRADRHHQPGLRRQRQQRHRAAVQLDLHAQEARWPTAASRNTRSRTTPGGCTGI